MSAQQTSIRRKLTTVILMTSCTVVGLTAAAFICYEIFSFRQNARESLATLAQVVAANSSGSLAFANVKDAREVLSALQAEPQVSSAALYDKSGGLFAIYPAGAARPSLPPLAPRRSFRFSRSYLEVYEPVVQEEQVLGTLYVRADLSRLQARVRLYLSIALLLLAGSALLAWVLSSALQQRISQPILALTASARAVSERRDYSVRAPKLSEDEIGVLTDAFNHMLNQIEERRQALRQSTHRLHLALESARIGTWDWDIVSDRITCDEYLPPLYGIDLKSVAQAANSGAGSTGEGWGERLTPPNLRIQIDERTHPEDRRKVADAADVSIMERRDLNVEYRVIWPDGSLHQLVSRGRAVYDTRGKPTRMTGVTMDVTEARQAERAGLFLAAIVESSDDAIIGKDLHGRVVSWNAGAERTFGYTAHDMIGQTVAILAPRTYEDETRALEKVRRGETVRFETIQRCKDGREIHVSVAMSPIRDSAGRIIGSSAIKRDITERKKTEEEILRLKNELEQRVQLRTAELAAANKELEAFTYSVAHDLRAPLRHMDAYATAMEQDFGKQMSPGMDEYLQRIITSSHKMANLVDDLLNLARVGRAELKRQPTALNSLVAEIIQDLRDEIKDRPIEWKIGALGTVDCDPGLVKLVFTNLLGNALKYTRPKAAPIIEVERISHGREGTRRVPGANAGEDVFMIRDNGVGFDMRFAEKLFGVFQRLHRAEEFEGTGVGLATVDRIVRKHGGRIWAEAEMDKGATFYFTLGQPTAES